MEDELFVMLDTTLSSFASSIEGYQRLHHRKGLVELQAAGLTETRLKQS
jgi:hypothetical protein